jgi:hypothetical protein
MYIIKKFILSVHHKINFNKSKDNNGQIIIQDIITFLPIITVLHQYSTPTAQFDI